jgi:hypothetical protein
MTPTFPNRRVAADEYEARIEHQISRAEDLYDLDGETFLRNVNGVIETGDWEVMS